CVSGGFSHPKYWNFCCYFTQNDIFRQSTQWATQKCRCTACDTEIPLFLSGKRLEKVFLEQTNKCVSGGFSHPQYWNFCCYFTQNDIFRQSTQWPTQKCRCTACDTEIPLFLSGKRLKKCFLNTPISVFLEVFPTQNTGIFAVTSLKTTFFDSLPSGLPKSVGARPVTPKFRFFCPENDWKKCFLNKQISVFLEVFPTHNTGIFAVTSLKTTFFDSLPSGLPKSVDARPVTPKFRFFYAEND